MLFSRNKPKQRRDAMTQKIAALALKATKSHTISPPQALPTKHVPKPVKHELAPDQKEQDVERLLRMLTYKRPGGSETEEVWIDKFIDPLADHPNVTKHFCDGYGNLFFEVCGGSKVLFTAHTDTVHHEDGSQQVSFDANLGVVYKIDGQPLGADDGAGCWMLLQIADAGIPCWLAFFRMEERGGLGSTFAAKHLPAFLQKFEQAVAFDRRGQSDIITHQALGMCASDEYAESLAAQLNKFGLAYEPSDKGLFTDTANLTDLIAECTNLSVGYDYEHTDKEQQDVDHLLQLRKAVLSIDWSANAINRTPGEDDAYSAWGTYSPSGVKYDDSPYVAFVPYTTADLVDMSYNDMVDAACEDPEAFVAGVWQLLHGADIPDEYMYDPDTGEEL